MSRSRKTRTGTVISLVCSVPLASVTVTFTGIETVCEGLSPVQVSPVGVPVKSPFALTVKPLVCLAVITAPLSVSTALVAVTALFSVAFNPLTGSALTSYLVGFLSSLSLMPSPSVSAFLGFVPSSFSFSSVNPSLSSSGSVISGIPSSSVSRWIVTGTSTSVEPLPSSETVTGILTSRSSSSLPPVINFWCTCQVTIFIWCTCQLTIFIHVHTIHTIWSF